MWIETPAVYLLTNRFLLSILQKKNETTYILTEHFWNIKLGKISQKIYGMNINFAMLLKSKI